MAQEWPALMDLQTAGAYLSLSPGVLLSLLRRERIEPVDLGPRLRRWRRHDLDALVERLASPAPSSGFPACGESTEGVDSALAAVERRALALRRPSSRRRHEVRQSHPAA